MRHLFIWLFAMLGWSAGYSQAVTDTLAGEVSFTTSQNIYVKFASTKDISPGDTLYTRDQGHWVPLMVVNSTSSTSCVGAPIGGLKAEKGLKAYVMVKRKPQAPPARQEEAIPSVTAPPIVIIPEDKEAEITDEKKDRIPAGEKIRGRLMAASYANFSENHASDRQRMRYTLTANAQQIGNTRLSAETYISFRHTLDDWQEVQHHFLRTFKIYSLALQYDIDENTSISLGRKINFNMSNLGAIDGVQAERKWKAFQTGVFAGSRPDHTDYGFNFDLLQFGAYAGHSHEGKNGITQTTLAFAEQRNQSMTDRRYVYFQHTNALLRHVSVFTSLEVDLYTLENNQPKSTLDITSVYASLRYKVSDKLSVFGSYDARKNIIYYETYKSFIDQLLEDETRQGLRFSFNYRPFKKVSLGASAGYRFQKDVAIPSKNLNAYLTFSRIPKLQTAATVSLVMIQSPYLDGIIYGIRLSRDLIRGKLSGEAEYRLVEYNYVNTELPLKQSIAGGRLSWRLTKKLSFTFNYEGEFRNLNLFNRIYTNVIQRF